MRSSDSGWVERSLYELATYRNGRAFTTREVQSQSGLPVIKIAELNRGITATTGRFAGDLDPRHRVEAGDLLFSWSGTIEIRRWPGPAGALNQHLFKVSATEGIDENYLLCLLQSLKPTFDGIVENQRTTMGHVKVSDLKDLTVVVPPIAEQRRIAEILMAVDLLIERDIELVRTLDQLIAARVSHLAAREGDEWPAVPLTTVARFINGGAYTKGASGSGRIVIRIRDLTSGLNDSTVFSDRAVPEEHQADAGDVLFSWSGTLGVFRWVGPNAIINQHIFKVLPTDVPAWFVFAHLRRLLPEFQSIASDKATTMGHIKRHHLDDAVLQRPPAGVLGVLDERLGPLWRLAIETEHEVERLTELRAAALGPLVSGALAAGGSRVALGAPA